MKKLSGKFILFFTLAGLALLFLSGCTFLDKLEEWKAGVAEGKGGVTAQQPVEPQQTNDGQQNTDVVSIPETTDPNHASTPTPENATSGEMKEVTLYFADAEGQGLKAVTASVPKVEGIAKAVINQLIAGPEPNSGLLATIPTGTTLRDMNIKDDGTCIVDFSKELTENHSGGVLGEELTVYSIVNTLTQFPSVQEVQIRVDGQEINTIAGHIDVSQAMARNDDLILP